MLNDQTIPRRQRSPKRLTVGNFLTRIFTAIGIAYLAVIAVGYFVFTWGLKPVTKISRYEGIIKELKSDHQELAHFPDQIPSTARDARFYYSPGFLQGATKIRLHFTLPVGEIAALEQRFRASHRPLSIEDKHFAGALSSPPDWQPLGEDFTSFLISPDLETAKKNWNHPKNIGISISVSRNQVRYWVN